MELLRRVRIRAPKAEGDGCVSPHCLGGPDAVSPGVQLPFVGFLDWGGLLNGGLGKGSRAGARGCRGFVDL